jgi:hypothetical protein
MMRRNHPIPPLSITHKKRAKMGECREDEDITGRSES